MQDASAGRRYNPAYCPAATLHCSRSDVPVPSQPYVYRSKLKWYILHPEQIETPQLHQAKWWWRASVFSVDGVRFVGNGNHRVCAALLCWSTWKTAGSAHKWCRNTPWSMQTTFSCLRAQPGAS
jgi:hypothetical protein